MTHCAPPTHLTPLYPVCVTGNPVMITSYNTKTFNNQPLSRSPFSRSTINHSAISHPVVQQGTTQPFSHSSSSAPARQKAFPRRGGRRRGVRRGRRRRCPPLGSPTRSTLAPPRPRRQTCKSESPPQRGERRDPSVGTLRRKRKERFRIEMNELK